MKRLLTQRFMGYLAVIPIGLIAVAIIGYPLSNARAAEKSPLIALQDAFVEIGEKVSPSVVYITTDKSIDFSTERRRDSRDLREFWPFEDFFREFVEPSRPQYYHRFQERNSGSGLIIDDAGHILTNNHLVGEAEGITVRLSDGMEFEGHLIGRDPKTDVAVIKIDDAKIVPAKLGDSDSMKVGHWVAAIGAPFQQEGSLTVGVVSAKGRRGFAGPLREVAYQDFMQTDASINPGNSGGPLVNITGEVIGINTFIVGIGTGIGFAIPINLAKEVADQLIKYGKVTRGYLGVLIKNLTPGMVEIFELPDSRGSLIEEVLGGTPADKAGLKPGDVVREVNGKEVTDSTNLQERITHSTPGSAVILKIIRKGKEREVEVMLEELPETSLIAARDRGEPKLGLTVKDLTPEMALELDLEDEGIVVTQVQPGSPADDKGMRRGDVILEINRKKIGNVDGFRKAVAEVESGDYVVLYVLRDQRYLFIDIKAEGEKEE